MEVKKFVLIFVTFLLFLHLFKVAVKISQLGLVYAKRYTKIFEAISMRFYLLTSHQQQRLVEFSLMFIETINYFHNVSPCPSYHICSLFVCSPFGQIIPKLFHSLLDPHHKSYFSKSFSSIDLSARLC